MQLQIKYELEDVADLQDNTILELLLKRQETAGYSM
jgi:hypothetical protein